MTVAAKLSENGMVEEEEDATMINSQWQKIIKRAFQSH